MGRLVNLTDTVKVSVPANTTIAQGSFVALNGILGLALNNVVTGVGETGEEILYIKKGIYETSQIKSGVTFSVGDKVYWDNTAKAFSRTATDNTLVGVVTEAGTGYIQFLFTNPVLS